MANSKIKSYYSLTKQGLVYGNAITVIAGFALASKENFNFALLLETLVGISLVIASGCVFNNYIDRDIDAKMERTKNRAIVTGAISGRAAILFGTCLGLLGFSVLATWTNLLATLVAFTGFFFYIFMYSLWWKRRSVHGTVIGSISGAVPPVVGYVAVSNNFDTGAIILFATLVFWQMPHFYAIAIRRLDDYAAAKVPVLPVKNGVLSTKVQMLTYIIAFTVTTSMLTFFGYAGYAYLTVALSLGIIWLGLCIKGFWAADDKLWARKMFLLSLIVLVILCVTISVDSIVKV